MPIYGDILIKVFNEGMFKIEKVFRLGLYTVFLDDS